MAAKTRVKGTTRTFPLPPKDFVPAKASARTLRRYGLPARPDDPRLARHWEAALNRPMSFIEPKFRTSKEKLEKLPVLFEPASPAEPERLNYLGGATTTVGTDEGFLRWIEGTWTLPHVWPPAGAKRNVGYGCSTWIGLGGSSTSGSLAAGWDTSVQIANNGVQQLGAALWWAWFPGLRTWLTNFPAAPGDTLSCVICLDLESTVRARITLHNLTTGQATTFAVLAPQGTELTADTGYWAISNMVIGFDGPYLARFGEIYFDDCNAGVTESPAILHPTQPIVLTDFDTGEDLSYTNILSETLLQLRYVGP
jgi:hypothetical protein